MDATYFAKISKDSNIVAHVTIIENKFISIDGDVSHDIGLAKIKEGCLNPDDFTWLPVTNARGTCNVGYLYLTDEDKFIPSQPFGSWVLNSEKTNWIPPVPLPADSNATTKAYFWVEDIQNWVSQDL